MKGVIVVVAILLVIALVLFCVLIEVMTDAELFTWRARKSGEGARRPAHAHS
jgi:hypothetical protein